MAFVESTARGGIFTSRSTSRVRASRVLIAMAILIGAVAWPVQTAEQVTFSVVADFGASLPYLIVGPLVRDADGTIYGTGQVGGAFNRGGVFKVDPSGVLTSLYDFSGADGEFPASGLVRGADGALYGTTNGGAGNTTGTIFRITTAGSLTTLHTFSARDDMTGEMAEGGEPETPLAAAADGSLYGIAHTRGDFDNGILFQITPAGAFTIVHAFGSEAVPLAQPRGGVVFGSDNALYGAVAAGGEFSAGGLYRMTTGGSVGLLHSFAADGSEGSEVRAPLTDGGDSALYGTASSGGTSNLGTVFSVTPGGTFTVLHSFAAFDPGTSTYPEGFAPGDGVTLANDGNLYGVTSSGGANMLGTIFRIERASQTFSVRKHLQDEGGSVVAPLIAGDDGKLYGASTTGGPSPYGAVFSFDPATSGSQIVLGFRANNPGELFAGLTRGDDGLLYGVGYDGGGAARGSIFRISEQGSVTLLHLFTGSDGLNPFAHLVKGPDGSLYGTTVFGGNSRGTVFKVTSAGTLRPGLRVRRLHRRRTDRRDVPVREPRHRS